MPLVRQGQLRALGVTSARRSAGAPRHTGDRRNPSGYDASLWYGLVGPAGLPADMVRRLSSELQRVLAEPQVQETLRTAGVDLEPGDPEALRVVMADPRAQRG